MKKKHKEVESLYFTTIKGITIATILDTRLQKERDCYPIKYRLIFQRKLCYYKAGFDMSLDEWQRLPKTKDKTLITTRRLIENGFNSIVENVIELVDDNKFSFENLNNRLGKGNTSDIFELFNNKINKLKENGKIGTAEWYYYSSKSLLKFINNDNILNRKKKRNEISPEYSINTLNIKSITPDFLEQYEEWLLDCGKKYTSISMFMRGLQAVLNDAITLGIITKNQYPFGKGKYERPEGEGRKLALDLDEINKLMNAPVVSDYEKRSRDLFYFSYLCYGININDLLRLKYSNIIDGEIFYFRAKTKSKSKKKTEIKAPLLPQMETIINKWGNTDRSPQNFIFPFFNNTNTPIEEKTTTKSLIKLMNDNLKAIGKRVGIDKISTYTARHSFATVLKRSGVGVEFISESLGHSDLKTTENYLASFGKDVRKKNSEFLTNAKA